MRGILRGRNAVARISMCQNGTHVSFSADVVMMSSPPSSLWVNEDTGRLRFRMATVGRSCKFTYIDKVRCGPIERVDIRILATRDFTESQNSLDTDHKTQHHTITEFWGYLSCTWRAQTHGRNGAHLERFRSRVFHPNHFGSQYSEPNVSTKM
jgi:hypothetical protein